VRSVKYEKNRSLADVSKKPANGQQQQQPQSLSAIKAKRHSMYVDKMASRYSTRIVLAQSTARASTSR